MTVMTMSYVNDKTTLLKDVFALFFKDKQQQ